MYYLEIICTAVVLICTTERVPDVQRSFPTRIECDRALMSFAEKWRPQGAWKMNCVQQNRI